MIKVSLIYGALERAARGAEKGFHQDMVRTVEKSLNVAEKYAIEYGVDISDKVSKIRDKLYSNTMSKSIYEARKFLYRSGNNYNSLSLKDIEDIKSATRRMEVVGECVSKTSEVPGETISGMVGDILKAALSYRSKDGPIPVGLAIACKDMLKKMESYESLKQHMRDGYKKYYLEESEEALNAARKCIEDVGSCVDYKSDFDELSSEFESSVRKYKVFAEAAGVAHKVDYLRTKYERTASEAVTTSVKKSIGELESIRDELERTDILDVACMAGEMREDLIDLREKVSEQAKIIGSLKGVSNVVKMTEIDRVLRKYSSFDRENFVYKSKGALCVG